MQEAPKTASNGTGAQAKRIAVRNVSKVFGANGQAALALARQGVSKNDILAKTGTVVAVNDISFSVDAGEIFVVMGLSGSGKSTLVRCLNRLQEPSAGAIEIDGEDIVAAPEERLRALRLEKITMVFQHFALLPHRTVAENVEYGLKMRGLPKAERNAKALKALDSVGLGGWAERYPANLSGGMQQRVGLARALALDPEILLMDEPFSALDPLIRRDMQGELLELQRRYRTTIIFITHDLNEALTLGDHVAVMNDGRFAQVGRPADIVLQPADDYVAAFTRDIDRGRVLPVRSAIRQAASAEALRKLVADGAGTIEGARPLHEAFGLVAANRPAVVVDAAGQPEGLVTAADITNVLAGSSPSEGG
ncbi:MAG: glycine betaine/L-proline ABC transporter ATP-binding protein [Mesorhizobium sp.]|nr:glycine betaine/L-proline ABC transporter ATP-binding protein [Mesorhizobium sp.]